ncbi:hypothetical protein PpBr36_08817 [Pyricularia pennisetigena]|uniref:hypothetical protein n=1 Tax=Pyricularia pennisetigena TaxID=1578925 RepID=UPI001151C13A|nr:hypothetical protein PpBr36_08817 [Pyricularia pennisetigena]TLS24576.1 hypothetical protein PpBr36_08817 [Pyricularia pennisetigena]
MPKSNKLRILCFGDSLTSGYSRSGLVSHPYEQKLVQELKVARPELEIETTEDGIPGDLTGFFVSRCLEHFGPKQPRYDWAIILGGTNDLARQYSPETIFDNLKRCWDLALSHGSKVLVLTVPEVGVRSRADEMRDKLNDMIRKAQGGNIYVHDHHAAVPYWSLSQEERDKYWDDDVHLTADGYDLMGKMIAARLVDILLGEEMEAKNKTSSGERPSASSRSRPGVKAFKGDGVVFEEEAGDSSKLRQGYVVVRRTDLD